jgi:hypothetical protein
MSENHLIALRAANGDQISEAERAKLSGNQLTLLLAGGSFKDLSAEERMKLSPNQLAMLAAGGSLSLDETDLSRLSATQRATAGLLNGGGPASYSMAMPKRSLISASDRPSSRHIAISCLCFSIFSRQLGTYRTASRQPVSRNMPAVPAFSASWINSFNSSISLCPFV